MSGRYIFTLQSSDRKRDFPHKVIIGREETETTVHVMLKLLGFALFFRDRIQIEPRLHDDNIPFKPDLVQLDYELRPTLWVECGECSVAKLNKLAVKVPLAEIWVIKRSRAEAESLLLWMKKEDLRKDRYSIVALDGNVFDELWSLIGPRNSLTWIGGEVDSAEMQFDFNGLWFELPFTVLRF